MVRKVSSSYQYYKYLENYSASFLRRTQTGWNYELGRRSNFELLVRRTTMNSMGYDDEHNFDYKTPAWVMNFVYKIGTLITIYYFLINIFYLYDLTSVFYQKSTSSKLEPYNTEEQPRGYENLYFLQKQLDYKIEI